MKYLCVVFQRLYEVKTIFFRIGYFSFGKRTKSNDVVFQQLAAIYSEQCRL